MIGIYKITSPSGKVYIGQSKDIEKRFSYYKSLSCKNQNKLYHSLLKYGFENHKFEVLKECSEYELTALEDEYIKMHDSITKGLNLKEAGPHGKMSEEVKSKISNSNKGKSRGLGRKLSNETKLKMSILSKGRKSTFLGKKHTEQTKQLMSELAKGKKHFLGKKHSDETKQFLSKIRKGKKFTKSHIDNLSNALKGNKIWVGKKHTSESIEKMRQAKLGKKASFETRLKMSESAKIARKRLEAFGGIETQSMAL